VGLSGGLGDDTINGGAGNDVIAGGDGNDVLIGGGGADSLNGSFGNDVLNGGAGVDSMFGGPGNDRFIVDHPSDIVEDLFGAGNDVVVASVSFVLPGNVDRLTLSGGDDLNGIGNAIINTITGNGGDNILLGLDANDVIKGGGGNDTLDGGAGDDTMTGGGGNDVFVVDSLIDVVSEAAGKGIDTVMSSVNITLPDEVENSIVTSNAGLAGTGNSLNNAMVGAGGGDILLGSGGADDLFGGLGDDVLSGAGRSDSLDGGVGSDVLIGGVGQDELPGGLGADTFRYNGPDHGGTVTSNGTRGSVAGDTITDFVSGVDSFSMLNTSFAGGVLPDGALTEGASFSVIDVAYNGTNAGDNANHDAGLATFVFSIADSTLYYDDDGDGAGYFVIATLATGGAVAAGDIVIEA